MRKVLVSTVLLSAVLLMAGGKLAPEDIPELVPAIETPANDCAFKNNGNAGKAGSFQHAKNYCNTLYYAGHSDWRLPTSDELMHLHRKPGQVFINFRGSDFWTSTPAVTGKYFVVFPADAYRYERKTSESNYVRCVRCAK
jgi:hypothetical protein